MEVDIRKYDLRNQTMTPDQSNSKLLRLRVREPAIENIIFTCLSRMTRLYESINVVCSLWFLCMTSNEVVKCIQNIVQ